MPTHTISSQEQNKSIQKADIKEGYKMQSKRTLGSFPSPKFMVGLLETKLSQAIVYLTIHKKQNYKTRNEPVYKKIYISIFLAVRTTEKLLTNSHDRG